MREFEQINRLKEIARFGKPLWEESPTAAVKIFFSGKGAVSFISVGVLKEYRAITTSLYSKIKTIQANYTLENFIKELVNLLRLLNNEQRKANKLDWHELVKELTEKRDIEAEIAYPIFGVLSDQPIIEFGDFKIYKRQALTDKYPKIEESDNSITSDYFLAQNVIAKSIEKCREIAERNFFQFENVANFITAGFHKTYKISLFNNWFSSQLEHLAFTNNKVLWGGKTLHIFKSVKIDNPFFLDETMQYGKVWKLITSNKNDLQNKILESIEWAGKASVETDDNKAFLLYMIAIESILNYSHPNSLYTPITSSLSDSVAFLLGKDKESRMQYAKRVTELYGKRSGIVHGSALQISDIDLHTAFVYSHHIIRKILSEEPYNTFTTKKRLCEYLQKEKKFEIGQV